jgi:uncharacterized protein YqfB (UPF0267 family)
MFVINDIELLARVGKHNILSSIPAQFCISISAIKLNDYSFSLKKQIQVYSQVKVCYPDDGFDTWVMGKRYNASIGDLSSLHIAKTQNLLMVLSNEDSHLAVTAKIAQVQCVNFDEFIRRTVKDQHMVQIYNLIKAA